MRQRSQQTSLLKVCTHQSQLAAVRVTGSENPLLYHSKLCVLVVPKYLQRKHTKENGTERTSWLANTHTLRMKQTQNIRKAPRRKSEGNIKKHPKSCLVRLFLDQRRLFLRTIILAPHFWKTPSTKEIVACVRATYIGDLAGPRDGKSSETQCGPSRNTEQQSVPY